LVKVPASGELLSLDVIDGREAVPTANKILGRKSAEGGISTWDASGIFFEIISLEVDDRPSARTLVLLYAADLFFRLRWQILPALEEGKRVVAAPYVETGLAFGSVSGLPKRWVDDVFRFAPRPSKSFRANATASANLGKPAAGFIEFCSHVLNEDLRPKFSTYFDDLKFLPVSDLHHIR
jgi:hypothetical protein